MEIKNKHIDRVYRFISPNYTTLKLDFELEDLEFVKKAAKSRNQNIHQFIEYAIRLEILEGVYIGVDYAKEGDFG